MATTGTMISFACESCQRPFNVPAIFAGRKATCKTCGAKVVVPEVPNTAPHVNPIRAAPPTEHSMPMRAAPAPSVLTTRSTPVLTEHANDTTPFVEMPIRPEVVGESAAPTADPSTPVRRVPRVAMISEAQSPPSALIVPSSAPVVPSAELQKTVTTASPELAAAQPAARAESPSSSAASAPKVPVRVRRLKADGDQMAKLFSSKGPIRIKTKAGDPPDTYQIEYHVTGLQRGWLGKPKKRDNHLVQIQLTSEYPRVAPHCKMLTPVFHPNIDESTICVGDHWTAGERLVDLVIRIGQMLAYQEYNIKSPLNGEAAMWADLHPNRLPVDSQNLHPTDNSGKKEH